MHKLSLIFIPVAGPAGAQALPPPFNYYAYHTALSQSAVQNLQNHLAIERVKKANAEKNGETYEPAPTNDDDLDLAFTPSMKLRQAHYAQFVERSRAVDPTGAVGLAETLKLDPIAMITPELAKVGLSPNNIADAYAVYWVEAWQAAHGLSGDTSTETARAVRDQAARAMDAIATLKDATGAQKQEFADALLVQAVLVGAAKEQAAGDPARLAQVGAAAEQGAKAMGLDLRAVRLTEEGFVAAR